LLISCILLSHFFANAQFAADERQWIDQLNLSGSLPQDLLSTRSAVFYSYLLTDDQLGKLHESMQRTGIDAIAYFELDKLAAGKDIVRAFANYFKNREIANIITVEKYDSTYRITATAANGEETLLTPGQNAWSAQHHILTEVLKELYRASASQVNKKNLLINDIPEKDIMINPIVGRRNEFYAMDLKVDPLAVPKTGIEAIDQRLEQIFAENYPLKYKLTEPRLSERDMRKQGLLYVLCFVHARGVVAKELLGYDMSKAESALVSVAYPERREQLKNIPSNTTIYKFYFKHIDSGNAFFGTRWDADTSWDQALLNQIRGMNAELRLN
jgi:hypothetical protein